MPIYEIRPDRIAQDVRSMLASAEFPEELTTAVTQLINKRNIDNRRIVLKLETDGDRIYLDVDHIIPSPEVEQVQVEAKIHQGKIARVQSKGKDNRKFDITIKGNTKRQMHKRNAVLKVVSHLCESGISPEQIIDAIPEENGLFKIVEGKLNSKQFIDAVRKRIAYEGKESAPSHFFCEQDEHLIHWKGETYALTKEWGTNKPEVPCKDAKKAIELLIKNFPDKGIEFKISGQ